MVQESEIAAEKDVPEGAPFIKVTPSHGNTSRHLKLEVCVSHFRRAVDAGLWRTKGERVITSFVCVSFPPQLVISLMLASTKQFDAILWAVPSVAGAKPYSIRVKARPTEVWVHVHNPVVALTLRQRLY